MEQPFDKDLELVKLQIAANDCLADAQINIPMLVSGAIVFFVLEVSIATQYPSSPLMSILFISIAVGFIWGFGILLFWTRHRYRQGVRKLDKYVKDIRAGQTSAPLDYSVWREREEEDSIVL